MENPICLIILFSLLSPPSLFPGVFTAAQTLRTDSRWIVDDETGLRVKLSCVNWPSHLDAAVAEGLSKSPADEISGRIMAFGFNCVRLTWPLFLFTNDTLASTTVRQSLKRLGLVEAVAGFQANNPAIIDLSLIDAYQAVVRSLARNNVLIILDNHLSNPSWCCSPNDGNGFFGDKFLDPDVWLKGLTRVATIFNDTKSVVGMSLRNELRGPRQNVNDWYRYMQSGAEAVHAANPDVLVILSGLQWASDLSFLLNKPTTLTFLNKTVYEVHWYAFADGQLWRSGNLNQVCGQKVADIKKKTGFLLDQGYPLFLSEFGLDMRGKNVNDNRFFTCLLGWAAELDIDWALWALSGSYYIREGAVGTDETYGVFNWNWCGVRNETILQKILALQYPFRGPGYSEARPRKVLFHPMTGLCVMTLSYLEPLVLGPCDEAEAWNYTPQKILGIKGSYFCLQADALGQPAKLRIVCRGNNSKWEAISESKMHLSSKLKDGTSVCLDLDSDNIIVTNSCKCVDTDAKCDPSSQWFKIVDSTRYSNRDYHHVDIKSTAKLMAKNLVASF